MSREKGYLALGFVLFLVLLAVLLAFWSFQVQVTRQDLATVTELRDTAVEERDAVLQERDATIKERDELKQDLTDANEEIEILEHQRDQLVLEASRCQGD
ncbi:hypothetical protein KJ910_02295 [Patescibacteria group bacterium]|nr:hypothetical protein [Patescibacteria group bacterium]MBU1906848.1 hypothetical protein [Patescibacteria group bacterium]